MKRTTADDINDLAAALAEAGQPPPIIDGPSPTPPCTKREMETWLRLASGWAPAEIARNLGIAQKTVDSHRAALLRRVGARNNSDLTRLAIEFGLEFLPPPQR